MHSIDTAIVVRKVETSIYVNLNICSNVKLLKFINFKYFASQTAVAMSAKH